MIRFLGSTGSGRRRILPGAVFSAVLLTLLVAVPVQAANPGVQNLGVFQLDGNAQQSDPPATPGDDWDNICPSAATLVPPTCAVTDGAAASTTATSFAHISDTAISPECAGGTNCTVFTGGGSKDPQDISSWNWKTDTGGLPSKDNLAHSFAARYTVSSTGSSDPNCPLPSVGPCKLLYFGSDRIDNSGDAQEGFWFFQNAISLKTDGTFSGVHAVGDLLILSDFSVGGTTSTINLYKWVASGGDVSTNLLSLGGSTSAACNRTPAPPVPDAFCGLVNATNGTIAPWSFTDKAGNSTYLAGEFYEGGVNLSAFNLGGECFASFASESRSSTSPTATLKDFVLGGFGQCTSGTATTPEDSSTTSISNGTVSIGTGSVQVKDLAVVTGTGSTTKPTGNVLFYICGPATTDAAARCNAAATPLPKPTTPPAAPSNGVLVGSAVSLVPGAGSSANATSALVTLTKVAHYCFRADYTGDSNYPESSDNSLTECFSVTPAQAALITQASCSAIPCLLGSTLSDTATLSGAANQPGTDGFGPGGTINATNGAPAGGSISFTAFGPDSCVTQPLAATSRTVSGNGIYPIVPPQAAVSFTPAAVGAYAFVAVYSPDGSGNTLAPTPTATCSSPGPNEVVTVTDTSAVVTDQNWLPNDSATITSTTPLSGTVVLTLYPTGDCTGTALYFTDALSVGPGGLSGGTYSQTVNSSNTIVKVSTSTTVSWKAVYTSNAANVTGNNSSCETTSLTIDNHHS